MGWAFCWKIPTLCQFFRYFLLGHSYSPENCLLIFAKKGRCVCQFWFFVCLFLFLCSSYTSQLCPVEKIHLQMPAGFQEKLWGGSGKLDTEPDLSQCPPAPFQLPGPRWRGCQCSRGLGDVFPPFLLLFPLPLPSPSLPTPFPPPSTSLLSPSLFLPLEFSQIISLVLSIPGCCLGFRFLRLPQLVIGHWSVSQL